MCLCPAQVCFKCVHAQLRCALSVCMPSPVCYHLLSGVLAASYGESSRVGTLKCCAVFKRDSGDLPFLGM